MQLSRMLIGLLSICLLNGCITQIWSGVSLIYDRHNLYKKVSDYTLSTQANYLIFKDELFKNRACLIDITAFNGDILLSGHVPTLSLKHTLTKRISNMPDFRHLYNEIVVGNFADSTLQDAWITTQIRSHILSDSSIDPNAFKVVTTDGVVYLMGEVRPLQGEKVIHIAQNMPDVQRVVTLLSYYRFSKRGG